MDRLSRIIASQPTPLQIALRVVREYCGPERAAAIVTSEDLDAAIHDAAREARQ